MPIDSKDLVPSLWDVLSKPFPTNTWSLGSLGTVWKGLAGTPTNDSAAAGFVGEYVSSSGSSTSLTTGTPLSLTASTISLTAGDWDVQEVVSFVTAATTNTTLFALGPNTVTNTLPATQNSILLQLPSEVLGNVATVISSPIVRFSLATTTNVFCVAQANFTVAGMTATGFLRARRVR